MKKRLFCTLLALLMLAVLLPVFKRSAAAASQTHLSAFTLASSADFVTPKAGDPVYYPSDRISVTGTTPGGLASALKFSVQWYGPYTSFYEGTGDEGVFTPGTWQLYLFVDCVSSDYVIDYDNELFGSGGDLNEIVLGGKTFRIGACGDSYIGYYTTFEVDSTGVAPMFVTSFDDTVNTGDACNRELVALGEAPITYSLKSGTLPYGTTLSEDGLLSGTFTTAGTFHFTVEAANAIGTATQDFTITVRAVTRIKAFTLLLTQEEIYTPIIGRSLYFPDDYISVTSTIPSGNEAVLDVTCYWYNHTTGESYRATTGLGKKFTEGEWELQVYVNTVNSDYVIDYEEYFTSGGSLETITLGGKQFRTMSLSSAYIGYGTKFYLGNPPETIDLTYDAGYLFTDQITGKEANTAFMNALTCQRGPSYYESHYGDYEGWYVKTDSEMTGFSDDPGDPSYLKGSEELLVPQDPYYLCFDVGLAPGCIWNAEQEFTVNGSDDVMISNYEDDDGNEHYAVSYQIISKEDLSKADVYGIEPKNYTGSALTQPNLKVVCNGETLQEGVHYVVQYKDNIEPGYADIYITGVGNYAGGIYRSFRIFDSDHPHEIIDTLAATSNIDEILVYGGEVTTPTFTVTSGAPAYFEVGMGSWYKLIDGDWEPIYDGGRFSSGQWQYACQIRIDGEGGRRYAFSEWPTCTVDGVEWTVLSGATTEDTYSCTNTGSPVFTVTGSGELIFDCLDSYRIYGNYVGEPIDSFSVAGSVDGGTTPYTFSKTSGPSWLAVSADGTVSGTPDKVGLNENLVVRVTDSADNFAEIEIHVGKTAKKNEDKTVISKIVANSDIAEMAVPGHTIDYPDFTVTEGAPAYFEVFMGNWSKKVGDEWQAVSNGEPFTEGIWQFSCQIRIDNGGETYRIADRPTVIVDGAEWTTDPTTYNGFDYSVLYAASPEIKVQSHPDTCTVTFDSNGGSAVAAQTVAYNTPAAKPADPKKNGYIFKGWYLGSAPYDFSTPVTEDITLKAKWEKIPAPPKFEGTVELNPSDVQFNGKTPYVIYNKKAQTPRVIVKDKSGKTVAASKYTVTYRNNTNPGTAYADVKMKDTGATASVWFKIYLPPTVSTSVQNVNNGIQISWAKVDGAKGYVIYRRAWNLVDSGWTTFERWNNTKNTTWTDTKVYAGTRYQYGVKAYFNDPMDNYNLGVVGPLKTTVRITTRTLNSVTPGSKKLTAKWSGSTVFTGYQVQVATDTKFTKDVKTVTIDKAKTYETTVKGLKAKTTYYVRVRSYHVFEGMTYYGGWSNVLNGKTK